VETFSAKVAGHLERIRDRGRGKLAVEVLDEAWAEFLEYPLAVDSGPARGRTCLTWTLLKPAVGPAWRL